MRTMPLAAGIMAVPRQNASRMELGLTLLLIGSAILGAILGLFYLKDRLESRTLARIAYSELTMRFTVIAGALIFIGLLMMLGKLLS
jgi:zinc transporter ZupT